MKILPHRLVQNHRNLCSQNQRANCSPRSEVKLVRNQAFSHRNLQRHHQQQHQHGKKKPRILKRSQLLLMKMLLQSKNHQEKRLIPRRNKLFLILMKLKKSLPQYLKSSQLQVKLVKCLVKHTFHNFKDNSKKRRTQGKAQRMN